MKNTFIITLLFFIFPFSLSAQQWQWGQVFGSSHYDPQQGMEEIVDMGTDSKGNVYVCGKVYYSSRWDGQVISQYDHGYFFHAYLAKFNCGGGLDWVKLVGNNTTQDKARDLGMQLTLDKKDNCYLSFNGGDNTFVNDSSVQVSTNSGAKTFKFSASGKLLKILYLPLNANAYYPDFDSEGNMFIWVQANTNNISVSPSYPLLQAGEIYLAKMDTNFEFIWLKKFCKAVTGGITYTYKTRDNNGNIYIAGVFDRTVILNEDTITSCRNNVFYNDGFLVKMDKDGNILWTQHTCANNSITFENIQYSAFDSSLVLTVNASKTDTIFGYSLTGQGKLPLVIKLDLDGNLKWGINVDSSQYTVFYGINSIDNQGNIYLPVSYSKKFLMGGVYSPYCSAPTSIFVKISPNKTNIQYLALASLIPVIPTSVRPKFSNINEKGELWLSGLLGGSLVLSNDTLVSYPPLNGMVVYDIFLAKYGFACNNDSALIAPLAANQLSAAGQGASISVDWTDSSQIEWGYKVYRAINTPTNWQQIATLAADVTHYTDANVQAGTVYWYKAAAYNNMGETFSNADSAKLTNVGINTAFAGSVELYPNPNKGRFVLLLSAEKATEAAIEIHDIMGKVVYHKSVELLAGQKQEVNIELPNLATGNYVLQLSSDLGNWTQKWVKEK